MRIVGGMKDQANESCHVGIGLALILLAIVVVTLLFCGAMSAQRRSAARYAERAHMACLPGSAIPGSNYHGFEWSDGTSVLCEIDGKREMRRMDK